MRNVLALLGYVGLIAGALAALVMGGLWVGARFLDRDGPGTETVSTNPDSTNPEGPRAQGAGEASGEASEEPEGPDTSHLSPAQLLLDLVDARGRYPSNARISIVPQGVGGDILTLFLRLSKQEWAPVPDSVDVVKDSRGRRPSRRVLEKGPDRTIVPAGYPLEVIVWTPGGAMVQAVLPEIEAGQSFETRLTLLAAGEETASDESAPAEADEGGSRLDRFLSVRDPQGMVVPEAAVFCDRRAATPMAKGIQRLHLREDTSGWMLIGSPGHGTLCLPVNEEGLRPDAPRVITLPPVAQLSVRVTEAEDGTTVSGLRLRVLMLTEDFPIPESTSIPLPPLGEGRTIADDRLVLDNLPSGIPLRIELVQGRQLVKRLEETVLLEAGVVHEVDIELPSEGVLRGQVLDTAGEPVADAEVWILPAEGDPRTKRYLTSDEKPGRRASTGPEGNFRLASLGPGRWWIGLAPGEMDEERDVLLVETPWAPLAQRYDLAEETRELELTAIPALRLGGTVILNAVGDEPQSPGEGLVVVATSVEFGLSLRTTVGRSGRFTFRGLAPGHFTLDIEGEEEGASVRVEGAAWQVAGDEGIRIYVSR